jgi:hypothetical protein
LSISLKKKVLIRAESAILSISLLNDWSEPLKLQDFTLSNNPLKFAVVTQGRKLFRSLLSRRIRDGLQIPVIEQKTMMTLKPKTSKTIQTDLLRIFGELPEGEYKLSAKYSSGLLSAKSKAISFKIIKSDPVYSKMNRDYLRAKINTIRTAWINKQNNEFDLFLMENSQYYPQNVLSSRKMLTIHDIQKVYPSLTASPDQKAGHLLWVQNKLLKVITLHKGAIRDVTSHNLTFSNFQVLEPSISDKNGNLHFVIVVKDRGTSSFQLLTLSCQEIISSREICGFTGGFTKYDLIFDEKLTLHLAWGLPSGKIFYTWLGIQDLMRRNKRPQIIIEGKPPILDLQLSKACEDNQGNLQLLLNLVSLASPTTLSSQLTNVNTGREVFNSTHELPELANLVLLQTILDLQCKPHFLFRDGEGALWFKSFKDAIPAKITASGEAYPSNIDYPALIVSSSGNRNYGIYLRYIKEKSNFVYKKLVSLV